MLNELKPCPCCGKIPKEGPKYAGDKCWADGKHEQIYVVEYFCSELNGGFMYLSAHGDTQEHAIENWNRRADHE